MARTLIWAPLVLALLVVGCTSTPAPFVPGPVVMPPAGWLGYCERHANDEDCVKD